MNYILEILINLFFTITLCFGVSYLSTGQMVNLLVSLEATDNQENNDESNGLNVLTEGEIFGFVSEALSFGEKLLERIAQIVYFVYEVGTVLVV